MQLANTRAIVTGGVSGLGFAVAQHLVASGARVALFDVNDERARPPSPSWARARPGTSAPT
jgi:NAD(P)-dependent dehydrogenase (short-subunit alcohol dehydrogenase family)